MTGSSEKTILLVNLQRCIGCYVCEVGCSQWHDIHCGPKRVKVENIGPARDMNNKPVRIFYPAFNSYCDLCKSNLDEESPFCVTHCPEEAIKLCTEMEALKLLLLDKDLYTIGRHVAQRGLSV